MEESAYVEKVVSDLIFAAQAGTDLRVKQKAFKQLIAYPQVAQKLVSDPVFFADLILDRFFDRILQGFLNLFFERGIGYLW